MSIDQDSDTDTGSGTFWKWSISSLTVTINVALDGEFMIALLLANNINTQVYRWYRWYMSYSFETDVLSSLRYLKVFFILLKQKL